MTPKYLYHLTSRRAYRKMLKSGMIKGDIISFTELDPDTFDKMQLQERGLGAHVGSQIAIRFKLVDLKKLGVRPVEYGKRKCKRFGSSSSLDDEPYWKGYPKKFAFEKEWVGKKDIPLKLVNKIINRKKESEKMRTRHYEQVTKKRKPIV